MVDIGKRSVPSRFGKRLKVFRKQAGLTQTELGDKIGLSKRMVIYYETQGGSPSPRLVADMAKACNVSADILLGLEAEKTIKPKNMKIWRQLLKVEQLSEKEQRVILGMIDSLANKQIAIAK